jgi:hypothetical protein
MRIRTMSDANSLRERIEQSQARQYSRELALSDSAADARDRLTTVAREHPLLLIAGGLAIGFAISALIPKSPTRRLSRNAIGFLAMVTELGVSYGRQALDGEAGQAGKDKLAELGNTIIVGALKLRDKIAARPAVEEELVD